MVTARPAVSRPFETSNWLLTSAAVSLLFHVLLVHYVGGLRLFDVEVFTSSVARWFNVVDVPRPLPSDVPAYAETVPKQAERPPEATPSEIPLLGPGPPPTRPALGDDAPPPVEGGAPAQVRLPDSNLPVVHWSGAPNVDQTLTQVGEVAPVRSVGGAGEPAPRPGVRLSATAPPGPPSAPRATIALPEVAAPRPASAASHAEALAPPALKPSTTPVFVAEAPPPGIEIPIQDAVTGQEIPVPKVAIQPGPEPPEEPDTGPVVPLADEVGVKLTLYSEPGDPRHYFRLEIAVAKPDDLPVIPKDVMFICDVSMSIRRHDLKLVRQAIVEYLRDLRPPDRFNVVVFSTHARKLFPDFVAPADERVAAAEAFIDRIPGQVRTDVYGVLRAVIEDVAQRSVPSRPVNIFFVSDGYSTSGIRDARRIVNEIGALARPNFALFPFDAGRSSNRYLLDLLAYRTRGRVAFTESSDEAAKVAHALFHTYDKPVLMDLRPLFTNLKVEETYPAFLPNLYADQPIVLYGRCAPGEDVTIQLQGKNPLARRALLYSHSPGPPDPSQSEIAREWARRKIHHMVSDMARLGETPELKAEIQRLGAKYHLQTPYSD